MSRQEGFYEDKSWGTSSIKEGKDLPTLKLHRLLAAIGQHRRGARLLEIGCGSGRILASIHDHDKSLSLTGIDLSVEQVRLARRDNPRVAFTVGDAHHLPFRDSSFDYVIFLDVIEHVRAPRQMLHEAVRVLKPGGTLHFFSPAEAHGVYRFGRWFFGRHLKEESVGHIQQFRIADLERLVRREKLTISKQEYSYHVLGSVMDFVFFALLKNKTVSRLFWSENKYYRTKKATRAASRGAAGKTRGMKLVRSEKRQSLVSVVFNAALSFANAIAYAESTIFKRTRWCATAVHMTARKGGGSR